MGRKEMQSLFSLITAAVFFTAAFFTGRQAAVLTGKFRVEREQSRQSRTKYCVVVDAGHGGDDPGKIGTAGTLEKEINLAIAKRLEALLKQADVAVVMTRTDSNGLYDENASGNQNSYPDPAIKGAQVFYYTSSVEGKQLAKRLQERLVKGLDPQNHRQAKANDSYYLLKKTACPIVIVECGFLSNPQEEALLTDSVYQERVAWNIFMGIMQELKRKKA